MIWLVFCRPNRQQIDSYNRPYPHKIWCPHCTDHFTLRKITTIRHYKTGNGRGIKNRVPFTHFVIYWGQKQLLSELQKLGYEIGEGCS